MKRLLLILILILCCGNCYADWLTGYSTRNKIEVDKTKIGADTSSVTVVLTVFTDAFYSACKSDGSDIAVTTSDGTTKINRLINKFNQAGKTLILKFNPPALSTTSNSIFYIYSGNASASESNANPYNSGYKAVWELEDDPSGTVYDDTSNDKDMTTVGSMTSSNLVTGKIGKAYSFNGSSQYAKRAASVSYSHTGTMYAWINANNVLNQRSIVGWGGGYDDNTKSNVRLYIDSLNVRSYQRFNSGTQNIIKGSSTLLISTWYFLAVSTSGSTYSYTVNTTAQTKTVISGADNGNWFGDCSAHLGTGYNSIGAIYNYYGVYFDTLFNGICDYVHVSDTQISSSDLTTIYNMTNDQYTFYTLTGETSGGSTSIIPQAQYYYNLLRSNNQ